MFQLVCDPSGVVVETSLKELVPSMMSWGNKLDHTLRVLLSHILGSAQVCFLLRAVFLKTENLSWPIVPDILFLLFSGVLLCQG